MLTLKPSDFRPAYKHQLNFDKPHKTTSIDPQTENKAFSARTQKPSQIPSNKINHVMFGPHTTPNSILTAAQKQVKFYPDAETKSIPSRT